MKRYLKAVADALAEIEAPRSAPRHLIIYAIVVDIGFVLAAVVFWGLLGSSIAWLLAIALLGLIYAVPSAALWAILYKYGLGRLPRTHDLTTTTGGISSFAVAALVGPIDPYAWVLDANEPQHPFWDNLPLYLLVGLFGGLAARLSEYCARKHKPEPTP